MADNEQDRKTFSLQGFDANHYKRTEQYVKVVTNLYNRAISEIADHAAKGKYNPDKPFTFDDYPKTRAYVQEVTTKLSSNIKAVIETGAKQEWLYACQKNDAFLNSIINTSKLPKSTLEQYQDRNLDALKTFQSRKVDGMDLSKRVWRYTEQFKDQIEQGLDVGLGEGRSAQQLSRDLRQNLIEPDRLFRRVRDKRGNLQLSKNAKAFNPGQGVYRSSAKNAIRLTRSEVNMSYRESDWLRWQQLDFVVGFEIKVSNRHLDWLEKVWNKQNPGKIEICDQLAGKYPKWFKFKGWHPQCMCYVVPILMDEETFDEQELSDLKAALRGTEYKKYTAKNEVTDVPDGFKEWVQNNMDRQLNWKSTPYFIRDNFKDGILMNGLKNTTAKQIIKPDPKALEMEILKAEVAAMKALAQEWGVGFAMLDTAFASGEPSAVRKALDMMEAAINAAKAQHRMLLWDISNVIDEADKLKIDHSELQSLALKLLNNQADYAKLKPLIEKAITDLRNKIAGSLNAAGYSRNMPTELKAKSAYLKGEDYKFSKKFFDLIDEKKTIGFSIIKKDGAYYNTATKEVVIGDANRNNLSNWHRKSTIYHEYGHAIDWQRDLRKSQVLSDLRNKQIKSLNKKSDYKIWVRKMDYDKMEYGNVSTSVRTSRVDYIDYQLKELQSKIYRMNDAVFTKRGITKWDVLEQILSTRDTIKSLVVKYGDGHSTAYFKRPYASEMEYIAHAFENAYIGNEVFKKYLPDIYQEMIDYIRGLK